MAGTPESPVVLPTTSTSRASPVLHQVMSVLGDLDDVSETESPMAASSPIQAETRRKTRRGRSRKRKRHQTERAKEGAKKRKAEKQEADAREYQPSSHSLRKIGDMEVVQTTFDVANLHAANGGFIGKRLGIDGVHHDVQGYLDVGYELVPWNGL